MVYIRCLKIDAEFSLTQTTQNSFQYQDIQIIPRLLLIDHLNCSTIRMTHLGPHLGFIGGLKF